MSANFAACAQAPAPSSAATGAAHSVDLEYREQSLAVVSSGVFFSPQASPFAKEPDFAQRKVVRGNLQFGSHPEESLPFAWDLTQGKLYLDRNHNQDLTDDGVLSSDDRNYGGDYYSQTFTNIHLSFKTPMGLHHMLVDLGFQSYNNRPNVSAGCHSLWEGRTSLEGKDWQVGFIETTSGRFGSAEGGYFLLRPWAARSRRINLQDGSLDGFSFCRNLFFDRQAYHVDCALVRRSPKEGGAPSPSSSGTPSVQAADSPQFRITFTEQPAELGELRLPGKFIQRLLLTSDRGRQPLTVVLDDPEPVVKVPVGRYDPLVHLQQGGGEAHRAGYYLGWQPQGPAVMVTATGPATLAIGGPLTNTVSVSRRGRELYLSYKLLGAGGQDYDSWLEQDGVRKNPGFAVYQAGKQLASGKFEFG